MAHSNQKTIVWLLGGIAVFFILVGTSFYLGAKKFKSLVGGKKAMVTGSGELAILPLNGVIMNPDDHLDALDEIEESDEIKALVIHIRSPGGAVAPTQEIFEKILKIREKKPVVCSMGEVAASGGYYIGAACEKVFARPGTLTGSIGVIMQLANLEGLYNWARIKPVTIKAGRFKDMGSPSRAMSESESKLFQELIDEVHAQFKNDILKHRKMKASVVEEYADGRIMTGETALRLGFVDGLGGETQAIAEATKLAKLTHPKINRLDDPTEKFQGFWSSSLRDFHLFGMKPFSSPVMARGMPYFLAPQFLE